MPIRLNLLAEAQAQEDARRRDPVKRALLAGIVAVFIMVVFSISLWCKAIAYNSEISSSEKLVQTYSDQNKEVINNLKQTAEITQKLTALDKLATNRFLVANLMNALQSATLEDVQLSRLRFDDNLIYSEEVKATQTRPSKPASVTERILLTLDAKDACSKPGDLIPKFKETIANAPYFATVLNKTEPVRLKDGSFSAQQMGIDGRPFQPFTLECLFPEKSR